MKHDTRNALFERLETRSLRSISLPLALGVQVDQTIGTAASAPSEAMAGTHGVIATTQQGVGLLDGKEVYVQRINDLGDTVSSAIHVNQTTIGDQTDAKVAIAQDGSFVVAFLSGNAAYVRQFAADGTPIGNEQKVSGPLDTVVDVDLAKGTDGKFLVAYVTNSLVTGNDIYTRLYNADGTAALAATLLNSNTLGDQSAVAIAALPSGQYVATFQSNIVDGSGYNIILQRLSSSGTAIGANLIVNDITPGDQLNPDIAYNAALNEIALVYQTTRTDGGDIAERLFNADGSVKGPSQIVNTITAGVQRNPMLAFTDKGTQAITYLTNTLGSPTGTLTMLDGNGLNLGNTDLGTLSTAAANVPVAGGAASSLLTALSQTSLNSSLQVSTQQISIQPLQILGTSQNDTVVVLPGVGSIAVTVDGLTINPLVGDFSEIVIDTGLGNDAVLVDNLIVLLGHIAVSVTGGDGDDSITTGDTDDTILGGAGNDTIDAGAGDDTLFGGGGNDSLSGAAGNDFLSDIAGTDTISGGAGIDTVSFAGQTSKVRIALDGTATSGAIGQFDTIANDIENAVGGAGSDTILGNALSNILSGGDGNDTIDGGLGADVIDGGNGIDTASYASRTANLLITLDGSATSGQANELDEITTSVENAIGGAGDDELIGNGLANQLIGGAGNDTLEGANGNDSLFAGSGDDAIDGGNGRDYIAGEAGNDTIDGGHSSDRIYGDTGDDQLTGGPGNDSIWAGDGGDRVKAGSGNDVIDGEAGLDTLYGDTGADTISGGADNDTLFGGTGRDSLEGDGGANLLFGQSGIDTLNGNGGADTLNGGLSRDIYYADRFDTLVSVEVLGS